MFRIIPRNEKVLDEMIKVSETVVEGAQLLLALLTNYEAVEEKAKEIKACEKRCDLITDAIIHRVNATFITPIDRDDIQRLTRVMDKTLNYMNAVADRLYLFKVEEPTEEAVALARTLLESVQEVRAAVVALKEEKYQQAHEHCERIMLLESQGDRQCRGALGGLFTKYADQPLVVMKLKDIYEHLETAIDRCEDVADTIEGVIVKNA